MAFDTHLEKRYGSSRKTHVAPPWQDNPKGISLSVLAKEAALDEGGDPPISRDHHTRGDRWHELG
jgi:hypothetical protein